MRQRFAVLALIALLVPAIVLAGEQQADADFVVHGTINVALGNENGLVVLTDSMVTATDPTGKTYQLPNPGQKLFKLDDQSVCAVAGFAGAPASSPTGTLSDLNTYTSAIIHEYVRQSKPQPRQSIDEKLSVLRSLFLMHIEMIANARDAAGISTSPDIYRFQIIVAGYDTDDKPKIGRMVLRTDRYKGGLISDVEDIRLTNVEEKLVSQLNGISDVAEQILKHPESKPDDTAISQYATSLARNAGASLTTQQMVELAKRLKYYTSQTYREVGGTDQVAVIQKPGGISVEQPSFPEPPRPLARFALLVGSQFTGKNSIGFTPDVAHVVAIRCVWNNVEREIDSNYYIGNDFTNSLLIYNGGSVQFGNTTNRVTDSALVLGPLIDPNDENVKRLEKAFLWSAILVRFTNGQLTVYATRH